MNDSLGWFEKGVKNNDNSQTQDEQWTNTPQVSRNK